VSIKAAKGAKFQAWLDLPASLFKFGFRSVIAILAAITINGYFWFNRFHIYIVVHGFIVVFPMR
jgi:hypothetical protein